jgi:hypothetical protein
MKLRLTGIFLIFVQIGFGQQLDWSSSKNWKVYDIHDGNAFSYSIDTLKHFKSFPLNDLTMSSFLKKSTLWSKDSSSVWMGLYVTTCEMENGSLRKVDISVFGGFFYDEYYKEYHSVAAEDTGVWQRYLLECMIKLSADNQPNGNQ